MTRLLNPKDIGEGSELYDSKCPECDGPNVLRDSMFEVSELSTLSLWCDDCGHGWWESA